MLVGGAWLAQQSSNALVRTGKSSPNETLLSKLLASTFRCKRSHSLVHRSTWPSWRQLLRQRRRSLLQRAYQWRIIKAYAPSDEAVLIAHAFYQSLLTRTQHFEGQGLEIAENPQQVQTLPN
jgi:hypothetical protein